MRARTIHIDAWIDVVSPWCRISVQQLQLALTELNEPVDVEFRMWRIDPEAPLSYGQTTIEVLCEKLDITPEQADAMLDSVRGEGREFGLTYNFEIARGGSVFNAHRLIKLAHKFNLHFEMVTALLDAHFVGGLLLSDLEVLTEIGVHVGIPESEIRSLWMSEEYADEVLADESTIRLAGPENRPAFFINDEWVADGLVRKDEFVKILNTNARI